jgi:hypothetical protein
MSLDDLPTSDGPRPAESAVQRVDRAVSNPYKITRAEELRLQLADEIVRGALMPGSPLDETDIARRFNFSRTPVLEALRQLAASGCSRSAGPNSAISDGLRNRMPSTTAW